MREASLRLTQEANEAQQPPMKYTVAGSPDPVLQQLLRMAVKMSIEGFVDTSKCNNVPYGTDLVLLSTLQEAIVMKQPCFTLRVCIPEDTAAAGEALCNHNHCGAFVPDSKVMLVDTEQHGLHRSPCWRFGPA